MKLTAPTSVNETAQTQAQSSNCDWDSLIGGGDLEDQLDAALEQGDAEDAAAGSLIDTGEQAAEPTEEAEAIEVPANPWPDDPRIDNESTYYTEGWQEIPVPIRKRTKVSAVVFVVETQDHTWQSGFCIDIDSNDELTKPLQSGGEQWATAQLAVIDALELIDNHFALRVENEKLSNAVREDLATFRQQVEYDGWQLPAVEATEQLTIVGPLEAVAINDAGEIVPISEIQQSDNSLPSVDQPRTSADDADALERIRSAQDEVDRLHEEWEDLKNEAKDAKKRWEAAVKRQGELIKELTTPLPLFDGGKKQGKEFIADCSPINVGMPTPEQSLAPALPDGAIGTKHVCLLGDIFIDFGDGKISFGSMGDVVTAFADKDGGLFLVNGEHRWDLEVDEYEEMEEEPAVEQMPASDKPTCSWRELPVNTLEQYGARDKAVAALETATGSPPANLGQLRDAMDRQTGGYPWYKDVGIRKNYQVEIEQALTKLVTACETEQA
jgi:hypothetical protein